MPADENARLAALQRTQLLDTPPDEDFDFLANIAAQLCDVPYAFITLVDRDRVWVKSAVGFDAGPSARDDSLCARSILEDGGLSISDLSADPRTAALPTTVGGPRFRMYHGANLVTADGHRLGTLCVLDARPRTLEPKQRRQLARLARQVMALVEAHAQRRELAQARATLEALIGVDELTGLAHRRALLERLTQETERARRFGTALSIVLLDLDHFKLVNELHGNAVGDQVLRNIGAQVRTHLRQLDLAGRHAGEQLCLVLPGTPPAGGVEVARQLREKIAATVHHCDSQVLSVTASFGVAGLEPGFVGTVECLVKAAERALNRAKDLGRNRVESGAVLPPAS
ncbi:MAG: sensor domain-containing diguanylate cyclase [Arenimonas sp.]